jgi:hypothetical protein
MKLLSAQCTLNVMYCHMKAVSGAMKSSALALNALCDAMPVAAFGRDVHGAVHLSH